MKILFCRIGWMDFYQGQDEGEHIEGSGSYVEQTGTGGEIHNFTVEEIPSDLFYL